MDTTPEWERLFRSWVYGIAMNVTLGIPTLAPTPGLDPRTCR